jgi:hypothetical protein
MNIEERKLYADLGNYCYNCGRSIVPKDGGDSLLWLLRNDPLIKRAYDMGRFDERERIQNNPANQ